MAERYEVAVVDRAGHEHVQELLSEERLRPGSVLHLRGRDWLVVELAEGGRVTAAPARYRVVLTHPDGREERGAVRRYRADAPRLGHALSTVEDGLPASWQVVDERLERDDDGHSYLALYAERDYAEEEGSVPDHELEHTLDRGGEDAGEGAAGVLGRAARAGLSVELVALDPGEAPDWEEAERYLAALGLEEIGDDLVELCGVDTRRDPQETWLGTVKERLAADLASVRADVEGDHDEIEKWDFRDGRVFAAAGAPDDESDPASSYGRLVRLVDAGVLGAAGFARVRKTELNP